MSHQTLQFIVGTALTDSAFCHQLLVNPEEAVAGFDLTDAERTAVTAITANGLPDFAYQLHQWITEQEGVPHNSPSRCLNMDLPPAPWPAPCLLSLRVPTFAPAR